MNMASSHDLAPAHNSQPPEDGVSLNTKAHNGQASQDGIRLQASQDGIRLQTGTYKDQPPEDGVRLNTETSKVNQEKEENSLPRISREIPEKPVENGQNRQGKNFWGKDGFGVGALVGQIKKINTKKYSLYDESRLDVLDPRKFEELTCEILQFPAEDRTDDMIRILMFRFGSMEFFTRYIESGHRPIC